MTSQEVLAAIKSGMSPRDVMRVINGGPFFLLGIDMKTGHKTYMCHCGRQRFTLVTPGAKLPDSCPKCGAR